MLVSDDSRSPRPGGGCCACIGWLLAYHVDARPGAERKGALKLAGARVLLPEPDADDSLSFSIVEAKLKNILFISARDEGGKADSRQSRGNEMTKKTSFIEERFGRAEHVRELRTFAVCVTSRMPTTESA